MRKLSQMMQLKLRKCVESLPKLERAVALAPVHSREKYDRYTPQPQVGSGAKIKHSILTGDQLDSSIAPSPVVPDNFFDSAGTVRMEAFVEEKERDSALSSRGKSYRT